VRPKRFRAYGTFNTNRAPILGKISTMSKVQTEQNEPTLEPRHLGVPSGVSKSISEPMVRLTQTWHLSCTSTNTISKRTETRFHMTHVT
jgi:hypothetical protein